jgi:hypothetical protein
MTPAISRIDSSNGNGTVGPEDYAVWRATIGRSVTPGAGADGNGNGIVDAADYAFWRNSTGPAIALAAELGSGDQFHFTSPEPATSTIVASILVFGAVACRCRPRRNRTIR